MLTIAIPTYKRFDMLKLSVASAVNQNTKHNYKIKVFDNSPSTTDEDILKITSLAPNKIEYHKNKTNLGMYGNWNKCISNSFTKYVTILNDDDLLDENFVECVLSILIKYKFINVLSVGTKLFGSVKARNYSKIVSFRKKLDLLFSKKIKNNLYLLNLNHYFVGIPHFGSLGVVLHREAIDQNLTYDSNKYPISDIIYTTNLQKKYGCYFLDQILTFYRIHNNESSNLQTIQETISKTILYKESLLIDFKDILFLRILYLKLLKLNYKNSLYAFWDISKKANTLYKLKNFFIKITLNLCRLLILLFSKFIK